MKEMLEAIGYPLPEDIEKLKWYGDFEGCLGLIDQRMAENIPETLRQKLRMEKAQIQRMVRDYVVTPEEAQQVFSSRLRDWKPEELEQLRRANVLDWIFVNGQVRYIDTFYENLIKIRGDIAARQLTPAQPEPGKRSDMELRREIVAKMKANRRVICKFTLRAYLNVSMQTREKDEKIHIWIPYPLEKLQMKNVHIVKSSPAYSMVAEPDATQRTVYFEGTAEDLSQVEITYTAENHMEYVELNPAEVPPQQPDFALEEQLPHIVFTPYLRALTAEVVGEETNPLKKARKIYDFITKTVNYSYMRSYISLPVIPEYCAARLRGDCGVQALTFITMCRIAGVPAKWQSGLYANENEAGCHDWAMFYVEPYGWRWADCSFGGSAWRRGDLEQWNFYFGNLDPYRVVLTSEFQGDFVPPTKYLRADPYDNQRGEVETDSGALPRSLWDAGSETLAVEILTEP